MCSRILSPSRLITVAVILFIIAAPASAAWLVPDWTGDEPQFPPGSWLWKTGQYPTCPIIYRTIIKVEDKPIASSAFRAKTRGFAYVFLNGDLISEYNPQRDSSPAERLDVELTTHLKPGRNVLVISTTAEGFSLKGAVRYVDGSITTFTDDPERWKVQKLAPLTMLEYEPCMKPDFDDSAWFNLKPSDEEPVEISITGLETVAATLAENRLRSLDDDAKWRLNMLAQKGIAVVDWTAYGWAGPNRHPSWLFDLARIDPNAPAEPGSIHNLAESLTSCVRLNDEKVNLQNHVTGLKTLNAPQEQIEACQKTADALEKIVNDMTAQIRAAKYADAASTATEGKDVIANARQSRVINDLCSCLDNKFGWLETNAILQSRPADWGLDVNCPVTILSSPLSPASLITLKDKELVLTGWDNLEPGRIYERKAPNTGPVCLWAKIAGQVISLRPRNAEGLATVYDRAANGPLEENWVLLVHDLTAGGPLPIQLVFLAEPNQITFEPGQKGTRKVTVTFDAPGARLFALRPLREWRGYLQMARDLTASPLRPDPVAEYIEQCRLWSRSLLHYPITFSEAFLPDPDNDHSILVADVYNYLRFEDPWQTTPMTIAPLPPLATFGLLTNYPGLDVITSAKKLGSNAKWGDNIAATGQDHIVYRVPIDPIKRFGGFTSYCFGGTDIGEPGDHLEIKAVALTGSNSYRPQHNQTGRRAIQTIEWCQQSGLQNCFNADEKWVPDVVAHYRTLAEECKDYPPDAVAYDLLNEPETRVAVDYDALIRKVTNAIRAIDKTHLIYVEAFPPWAPGAKPFPQGAFDQLKLTGDPLTCYSFHDYEFRLPPRWPNDAHDITTILDRWIPVFRYSVENRVPIHLGEFGAFEQTKQSVFSNKCTITLLTDYLKIFDQFGWHFHYYSNRGVTRVKRDGSLAESLVQDTYRQYFEKGTFNINH